MVEGAVAGAPKTLVPCEGAPKGVATGVEDVMGPPNMFVPGGCEDAPKDDVVGPCVADVPNIEVVADVCEGAPNGVLDMLGCGVAWAPFPCGVAKVLEVSFVELGPPNVSDAWLADDDAPHALIVFVEVSAALLCVESEFGVKRTCFDPGRVPRAEPLAPRTVAPPKSRPRCARFAALSSRSCWKGSTDFVSEVEPI